MSDRPAVKMPANPRSGEQATPANHRLRWFLNPAVPIGAFVLFALAIIYFATLYYSANSGAVRHQALLRLETAADHYKTQTEDWLGDQLGEITELAGSDSYRALVQQFLATGSRNSESEILDELGRTSRSLSLKQAMLLDAKGQVRLSRPGPAQLSDSILDCARRAVESRQTVVCTSICGQEQEGVLVTDTIAPLMNPGGAAPVVLAALLLRTNADVELLPKLHRLPSMYNTLQPMLVRREGEQISYLNIAAESGEFIQFSERPAIQEWDPSSCRDHHGASGFRLMRPLPATNLLAADILSSGEALREGPDYRSVPSIAAARRIEGTDWTLIVKADRSEILQPLESLFNLSVAAASLLIILAGTAIAWTWQTQKTQRASITDLREERQALRGQLDALSRYANDICITADAEGRILDASYSAVEAYGHSLDDLRRMHLSQLRSEEEQPGFERSFDKLIVDRRVRCRTIHRRKDGETFPVEASYRFLDFKGQPIIHGIIRDISESERYLRRIEHLTLYNTARSEINKDIARIPEAGKLLQASCETLAETGDMKSASLFLVKPDRTIRKAAGAGVPFAFNDNEPFSLPAEPGAAKCALVRSLREGTTQVIHDFTGCPLEENLVPNHPTSGHIRSCAAFPLVREGETAGALSLRSSDARAFDGELVGVLEEIAGDLAFALEAIDRLEAQAAAEESLQASERRFRDLFDDAPIGYLEVDQEGRISRVNKTGLGMSGYAKDEILGMPLWSFVGDPQHREVIEAMLSGGMAASHTSETVFRAKDGNALPVMVENHLIRNSKGCISGLRTTIVNIEEISNVRAQLYQSQKMEGIGRLAGGVAHDFNNYLTAILGYTELLMMECAGDKRRLSELEEIRKAAGGAANLTRQLLAFSRRQVLQPTFLLLSDSVSGVQKMLRRLIGEDIELQAISVPDLRHVHVDAGLMEQVLINLAVNARDAMPQGGKLIIETANEDPDHDFILAHPPMQPGSYVRLKVTDTGVGMDEEIQRRAFEPFFTTKEKGSGTGLGLSTVYGIVKQSGGYIWIGSKPGRGTAVTIYLPACEARETRPEGPTHIAEPRTGSEIVLLVEDDEMVRNLAHRALEHKGYRVMVARNGVEAMELAAQAPQPIDLLVTDIVMPKMGGIELSEKIAEMQPGCKVLYLTGYADRESVRGGTLDAGKALLNKPFTPRALADKVRSVLDAAP